MMRLRRSLSVKIQVLWKQLNLGSHYSASQLQMEI